MFEVSAFSWFSRFRAGFLNIACCKWMARKTIAQDRSMNWLVCQWYGLMSLIDVLGHRSQKRRRRWIIQVWELQECMKIIKNSTYWEESSEQQRSGVKGKSP